ncbi:MAG: hypothetical protein Q9171_000955 [Xanthocarpia ochracea]
MSYDQGNDENPEESNEEEASSLLPRPSPNGEQHHNTKSNIGRPRAPVIERRQSSLSIPPPNGLPRKPRTPNRVRFEVEEHTHRESASSSHTTESDEEDYFLQNTSTERRGDNAQRAPLLTGIEAPSVTVASTDFDLDAEHLLENSRPKSGMRSAFMNMANSIMYVDWTIRLIVTNSKLSGANSFQATVEHCYGRSGLVAISVGARKTRTYVFLGG